MPKPTAHRHRPPAAPMHRDHIGQDRSTGSGHTCQQEQHGDAAVGQSDPFLIAGTDEIAVAIEQQRMLQTSPVILAAGLTVMH